MRSYVSAEPSVAVGPSDESIGPSDDVDVIVEIPYGDKVKYEWDEQENRLRVDRRITTCMTYPGNYGFIPNTISGDEDPVDVLIVNKYSLRPNCIVKCRVVGALLTEDEKGIDEKIIAVPVCDKQYKEIMEYTDLDKEVTDSIRHFFTHYKDIDDNKWVKVVDYISSAETVKLIQKYRLANHQTDQ